MTVAISAAYASRSGTRGNDNSDQELIYQIYGATDDADALTALEGEAPATYADNLVLQSYAVKEIGEGIYLGTASYGTIKPKEPGDAEFRFDTSGGSSHITQSIRTVKIYSETTPTAQVSTAEAANVEVGDIFSVTINGHDVQFTATIASVANVASGLAAAWASAGFDTSENITATNDGGLRTKFTANEPGVGFTISGLALDGGGTDDQTLTIDTPTANVGGPNHHGAIGVTKDSIEGCDIEESGFAFSITRQFDPGDVTSEYMQSIRLASKTWNSAEVTLPVDDGVTLTFAPGELFLVSVQGGKKTTARWEMTFNFKATQNVSGKTCGTISGISKRGWDYLWVQYQDAVDDQAQCMIKKPFAVFVEQVYESSDLNDLTI